jgi:hypothetical protein
VPKSVNRTLNAVTGDRTQRVVRLSDRSIVMLQILGNPKQSIRLSSDRIIFKQCDFALIRQFFQFRPIDLRRSADKCPTNQEGGSRAISMFAVNRNTGGTTAGSMLRLSTFAYPTISRSASFQNASIGPIVYPLQDIPTAFSLHFHAFPEHKKNRSLSSAAFATPGVSEVRHYNADSCKACRGRSVS